MHNDIGESDDALDVTDELIAQRHAGAPGALPEDMAAWMRGGITALDALSLWVGRVVCLLLVPLMLAMVYEVVARKVFVAPTDWAFDVSRMLCGAMFMLGAGYALMRGVHIRADFIYRLWRPRHQAAIDGLLYVVLFFPSMAAFAWVAGDCVMEGQPVEQAPRVTLKRLVSAAADQGMRVKTGVEAEYFLTTPDGSRLERSVLCQ